MHDDMPLIDIIHCPHSIDIHFISHTKKPAFLILLFTCINTNARLTRLFTLPHILPYRQSKILKYILLMHQCIHLIIQVHIVIAN